MEVHHFGIMHDKDRDAASCFSRDSVNKNQSIRMNRNDKQAAKVNRPSTPENEDRARRILVTLHPVVQRLLQVLRELNVLNAAGALATPQQQQQFQALLRVLLELLVQYTKCTTQSTAEETSLPQADLKLRSTLLEYCLQPCMASSKILLESNNRGNSDPNTKESSAVEETVRRKIWIETTRTISKLQQAFADCWTVEKRIQVVQSLVASLPPLTKGPSLDSDVETRQLYFGVLTQMWNTDGTQSMQRELTQGLVDAWPQSALVARIAETCLESSTQLSGSGAALPLQCLALWITQTSPQQPQLWQRLFPGIFHALYRVVTTALRDFRQVEIAGHGLEVLVALCQAVGIEQDDSSSDKNDSPRAGEEIPKLLAAMQSWKLSVTTHETTSRADSSNGIGKDKGDKGLSNSLFWSRVGQNLGIPMQRLTTQGSGHGSESVRAATLRLACELQGAWQAKLASVLPQLEATNGEAWDKVQDTILDASIRLREDSNEAIQAYVNQIKQTCTSDRLASSQVFERFKSIWDDVFGLTLGQQWVEWTASLKLLEGYLAFLKRRDLQLFLKTNQKAARFWTIVWTVDLRALNNQWHSTSDLTLPWKYLDRERLHKLTSFVHAICSKLGPRSVAVLVDDTIARCVEDLAVSCLEGKLLEWVGLLQFSRSILQNVDCSTKRGAQAADMLFKSTLPVAVDVLSRTERIVVQPRRDAKAIACFDVSTLQFLSTLVGISPLQSSIQPLLLFQVILRHSCSVWSVVRDAAGSSLEAMTTKNDLSSLSMEGLIAQSLGSLLGTTLARLRTGEGSEELTETIRATAAFLRLGRPSFEASDGNNPGTVVAQTKEVLMVAVNRFDRWAVHAAQETEMTLAYIEFFETVLLCLSTYMKNSSESPSRKEHEYAHPTKVNEWINLLDEFRIDGKHNADEFQGKTADEDAFGSMGSACTFATKQDTNLVARVVSIATYLLSHPDLKVQIASCELLSASFAFLLSISKLPEPPAPEEELNGAKNAILRHIADCWPSLAARTNATAKLLKNASTSKSLVIATPVSSDQSVSLNFGEMRVFLSRVLQLVSNMVEASDDFMASRFRESVWPWADQAISESAKDVSARNHTSQPSTSILLESALQCLCRTFRHRPTGVALAGLIPTIGTRVLSLLHLNDKIANSAVETAASLIHVDGDALLRPLCRLAKISLAKSPFLPSTFERCPLSAAKESSPATQEQTLAGVLLEITNEVPEQSVE